MELLSFLNLSPDALAKAVLIVGIVNVCLSSLATALNGVAGLVDKPGVGKAGTIIGKIAGFLKSAIDFLSANVKH